jgi:predicted RNA polymerase sigma factor
MPTAPTPPPPLLAALADDPRLARSPALALARADVAERLGERSDALAHLETAAATATTAAQRAQIVRRRHALAADDVRRA